MRTLKIPKWNVVKSRFPKFCKRVGAFISACFIASYSLLTAPIFGFHVRAVDSDAFNKAWRWLKTAASTAIDILNTVSGDEPPTAPEIVALIGNTVLNVSDNIVADTLAEQDKLLNSEVDISTTIAVSGVALYKGEEIMVTSKTGTGYRFEPDEPYYNHWFRLFSSPEFAVDVSVELPPESNCKQVYAGYDYIDDDGYTTDSTTFRYYFDYYDANMYLVNVSNIKIYAKYWYDGQSKFFTEVTNVYGSPRNTCWDVNYIHGDPPVYDDVSSLGISSNSNTHSFSIASTGDIISRDVVVGPSTVHHFPSHTTNIINNENYIDYINVCYDYITYKYPVWEKLVPYNDFEPPTEPATDPSEITPTETGTGTVVIIDPFTLPPEWLEDNAELETDHYELDPGLWQDPLDAIEQYKQQVSPLQEGEDDSDFWRNNELVAPADVTSAMYAFQEFCVTLLQESRLLVVIASCLAFGLIIRLISLK